MKLPELVLCAEEATANSWLHNKENKMATWTDTHGRAWPHDDDKMGFVAWISADPALTREWEAASTEHSNWMLANPNVPHSEANGSAAAIFQRWMAYANAF